MIKLLVDSTCELREEDINDDFVRVIPIRIHFPDGKEYLDGVDITKEAFFKKMAMSKELPTTSQINAAEFEEIFREELDAGNEILGLFIGGDISGTLNSARLAKEEIGSNKIELVDSKTVSVPYQALANEAIRLIKSGLNIKEVKRELEVLREKVILLAVIDDLTNLVKGGRLSAPAGFLAGVLNVKPIITIRLGRVEIVAKALGFMRGLQTVNEKLKDYNIDFDRPFYVGHASNPEGAEKLGKIIAERSGIVRTLPAKIGAAAGVHTGIGCTGVVFFEK